LDCSYIYINKAHFQDNVVNIQRVIMQVKPFPVISVYFLLVFVINYFIIQKNKNVKDAFILGLVIYAVYEFTNLALLKNWKVTTALVDTLWGGLLFGSTTFFVNKLTHLF